MSFEACWVIYDHPRDYPDYVVLRKRFYNPALCDYVPSNACTLTGSIEEARKVAIAEGATMEMPVFANDDPVIAEVWM